MKSQQVSLLETGGNRETKFMKAAGCLAPYLSQLCLTVSCFPSQLDP